jgi:probable rRNA maturation factor
MKMDKIKVEIKNEQNLFKPDMKKIKEVVRRILKKEGCQETEVSILITDDERIRQLNKNFRNKNEPTDVLAFCQHKKREEALKSNLLGDVVISVETAKRQASKYGQSLPNEIYRYLIHGLLHLIGYKDESSLSYQKMKKKEEQLLEGV